MTTSTPVERRRRLARRALLSLSTILCSGVSLPAFAQDAPPKTFAMTSTGVNLLNLSFVNEVNDLSIGPLTLTRSYVSGGVASNAYFGSWSHNFDIWARVYNKGGAARLAQTFTEIIVGRSVHRFDGPIDSSYPPPPENDETGTSVSSSNGAITYTDRDGTVYLFSSAEDPINGGHKVSTITSPDGSILSFSYASNKLKTVLSNRGYALVFDYAGNNVLSACGYNTSSTTVSTASTCAGSTVRTFYKYNNTNLISATDVLGQTTQYQYTGYPNTGYSYLTCITEPGASGCKIANTWSYRNDIPLTIVTQQQTADGSVWKYDCSCGSMARAIRITITRSSGPA